MADPYVFSASGESSDYLSILEGASKSLVGGTNSDFINKGKVAHLYSATGSTWPSYLQNILHYLPGRATPPNLGMKIPRSHLHTHAGWGFDLFVL